MKFTTALAVMLFSLLLSLAAFCAESLPTNQLISPNYVKPDTEVSYYVEVSISRNLLTLYEIIDGARQTTIAEYQVGTAVRGLHIHPLGLGTVTCRCFVMGNSDGLELARRIRVGTVVNIVP